MAKPARKRTPARLAPAADRGWNRFYRWIRQIPRGRVTTYAGVAALAGNPHLARHVGFALAALRDTRTPNSIPWHRVLGARSRGRAAVSIRDPTGGGLQRQLLEAEGVEFDVHGNVSLEQFGWARPMSVRRSPKRASPPKK